MAGSGWRTIATVLSFRVAGCRAERAGSPCHQRRRRFPLRSSGLHFFFRQATQFFFYRRAHAMFGEINLGHVHAQRAPDLGGWPFFEHEQVVDRLVFRVCLPFYLRYGKRQQMSLPFAVPNRVQVLSRIRYLHHRRLRHGHPTA